MSSIRRDMDADMDGGDGNSHMKRTTIDHNLSPHPFGDTEFGDILCAKLSRYPNDLHKALETFALNCRLAKELQNISPEYREYFRAMLIHSRTSDMKRDLRIANADRRDTVDRLKHLLRVVSYNALHGDQP